MRCGAPVLSMALVLTDIEGIPRPEPAAPGSGTVAKDGSEREDVMLELLEGQTKLTANQWKIALAATLGGMLDFFDFLRIGFVLAYIVKDWHLTYGQSGLI